MALPKPRASLRSMRFIFTNGYTLKLKRDPALPLQIYAHGSRGLARQYANQSRKQVTVINDDGSVSWKSLTVGEKVARTAQQTGNVAIITAGVVGLVRKILYL